MNNTRRRTPDSDFGARLRLNVNRLLAERSMTAPELYEKAGLSRGTYSQIFKSKTGPRLSTLRRLADALRVEVVDLLRGV